MVEEVTLEERARLRELLAAASPRPWVATDATREGTSGLCASPACMATHRAAWTVSRRPEFAGWCTDGGYSQYGLCEHDAALIVAAVNALPALLDALEESNARIAWLEDAP